MSHREKSVTPETIVALKSCLNCLVVESPHRERDDRSHDETDGNGPGRGNGKR
jgi:hypothetical protein